MTPADLGFPDWFTDFRPAQEEAIEFALTSERRFTAIGAPPGVGKSGVAYALARLLGGRTVILTSTLGLQDQYTRFPFITDMRGRANYHCWCGGTCEDGARMGCGDKAGCPYLCAYRAFQEADVGVTSYAYHLAAPNSRQPDTLICDEAGEASEWLSRSLDFHIGERECREAKEPLAPTPGDDIPTWLELAPRICIASEAAYLAAKGRAAAAPPHARDRMLTRLKHAESFLDRAKKIVSMSFDPDNWVITREDGTDDGRVWRFECVWPGMYRERLFRGVKRVVLMSATLRPKTLQILGVPRDDVDFREWGRQFPAANGPVIWLPTARVNHRMSAEDERRWLDRHAEIFRWGSDRNGLDHTVSYARAKRIAENVGNGWRLLLNGAADAESSTAREAYDRFVKSPTGTVLISPSFSTGWDFAGRIAEWQILSKLPFPDTRSKVMQARCDRDRTYPDYLAAQGLVQACGRINRSEKDLGTTILVDDNWTWFRGRAEPHMPKWFKVRKEERLPKPLPKL